MTILNDCRIVLLYFDEGEAPYPGDDRQSFVFGAEGDVYVVQVNWKRPSGGILASEYDIDNRDHVDRVNFVVRQINEAMVEFLDSVETRVSELQGVIKAVVAQDTQQANQTIIEDNVHYKAAIVKQGVNMLSKMVDRLVEDFISEIGCKIGIDNGDNTLFLNDELYYDRELSRRETVDILPFLSYQDRLTCNIKSRIFACDESKLLS